MLQLINGVITELWVHDIQGDLTLQTRWNSPTIRDTHDHFNW